ncbi:MAG: DUF952 domain-containing protein [Hyphococcus sp.]
MPASDAAPSFVYRIAARAEWAEAQQTGSVPLREIDQADGYVHLSTREQLLETARLHFPGARDLLALEIPVERIASNLRFELAPKRGEAFPHLYAPLDTNSVARVFALVSDGGGFRFGDEI